MRFIEAYATKNPVFIPDRKIEVKGIVVHSVGCAQSSGANAAKYFNKDIGGCVHGFMEANGDFYMTMPIAVGEDRKYAIKGGHAGGSANNTHLGIELMETEYIKYTTQFTIDILNNKKATEAIRNTYFQGVELFAYLCNWYNLDPLKDGVIVSHWECYKRGIGSNHQDPEHIWSRFGLNIDEFREDIDIAMKIAEDEPVEMILPAKPAKKKSGKTSLSSWLPKRNTEEIK